MTEFEAPDWFCELFGRVAMDWVRDLERIDEATIVPGEIHPSLQQRSDQLWLAVVAHQTYPVSTAVDTPSESHPYDSPTERPSLRERMGQTFHDLTDSDVPTAVARLGFPSLAVPNVPVPRGSDDVLRPYAPGMYVTREAAVNVAPKIRCPGCEGNGYQVDPVGDSHWCDDCQGTGEMSAPVAVPRETGAAPEGSELVRPLTDAERAEIESEQAPPEVVAAQVAAAQSGLAKMRGPR